MVIRYKMSSLIYVIYQYVSPSFVIFTSFPGSELKLLTWLSRNSRAYYSAMTKNVGRDSKLRVTWHRL